MDPLRASGLGWVDKLCWSSSTFQHASDMDLFKEHDLTTCFHSEYEYGLREFESSSRFQYSSTKEQEVQNVMQVQNLMQNINHIITIISHASWSAYYELLSLYVHNFLIYLFCFSFILKSNRTLNINLENRRIE